MHRTVVGTPGAMASCRSLGGYNMSVAMIRRSGGFGMAASAGLGRRGLARYGRASVALAAVAGRVAAVAASLGRFSGQPVTAGLAVGEPAATLGYLWYSAALPMCWVVAVGLARAYEGRF